MRDNRPGKPCPDCSVGPGQEHCDGCDVERCAACGMQRLCCGCSEQEQAKYPRLPWTGEWPGTADCRRMNLWAAFNRGWRRCSPDAPGATEDLNSLPLVARWNPERQQWEPKPCPEQKWQP